MAAKVLIHEWVTGGGLAGSTLPPSWASEGRAMRLALARDFHQVGGVDVVMTLDARFEGESHPWQVVAVGEGEEASALSRLAPPCDFTLVIAPETDGVLAEKLRLVEQSGGRSLGSTPAAVALAGNKLRLHEHLAGRKIRTVPTTLVQGGLDLPSGTSYPAVVKPNDGAGCLSTYLLDGPALPPRWRGVPGEWVLQPFCPGEPFSVTFLIGPSGSTRLVGVGRQRIGFRDGAITYEGGRLPAPSAFASGAPREAVRSVAGLRGVVGVDFLRDPETGEATVVEINPRPTTSYVGLVRLLPPGAIARAWLDAFTNDATGDDLPDMLAGDTTTQVEFRADGTVRDGGWATDDGPD